MSENHHIRVVQHDRYDEGTSSVPADWYWTVECSCGQLADYDDHEYQAKADDSARQHAAWIGFQIDIPGTITIVRTVHAV